MNDHSTDCGSGDDELASLEARINELLPPRYVGCFEDVSPSSMGSASLRYDAQGRVAWSEIWTTFCHLALAGGPPHRGRLLGPVAEEDVRNAPEPYEAVVAELERALKLCVKMPLVAARQPGWIGLKCDSDATAAWLVRAIVAENVIARYEGAELYVPAGPGFRIEKEIKNVVVCVAKTCHYLFDHLEPEQQPTGAARPLIGPPLPREIAAAGERYEAAAGSLEEDIRQATGLATLRSAALGWVGVRCESQEAAVWMLRAVAVEDVLVRREEATLFVPVAVCPDAEGNIAKTVAAVVGAHRLWRLNVNKTGGRPDRRP
jgi:sirohydrochlorin cobaltochelatase